MDIPIPIGEGFLLTIGLIIAIGPQNLFVLKQGLIARHALTAVLTCVFCDCLLIGMGAMGLGSFIARIEWLRETAMWGGALFLICYGVKSWWGVYRGHLMIHDQSSEAAHQDNAKMILMTGLGFSLLNPHAILDTIVLIGGIAAKYDTLHDRFLFALGAVSASTLWFFGLAYGARLMRPLFLKKSAAATFELLSGTLMLWISWGLITSELSVHDENLIVEVDEPKKYTEQFDERK